MKVQACQFRRTKNSEWEDGVAILQSDFNSSDVKSIISEDGESLPLVFDYDLAIGPLCYIDTTYYRS